MSAPTAGLILAAGAGTRFGDAPKQLADVGGRPLLQWAVDAQTAVDPAVLGPIVVVLGAEAGRVAAAVDFRRARTIVCADWRAGQSASLRDGLRALGGAERVLVTLGDMPFVTPAVIAGFAGDVDPPGPVRALYDGRPGHPVVLTHEQVTAFAAMSGARDEGARGLLSAARRVEIGHLCSGRDVDTPEDLEEVRDEARAIV